MKLHADQISHSFLLFFAVSASCSVAVSEMCVGLALLFWLIARIREGNLATSVHRSCRAISFLIVPIALWIVAYVGISFFAVDPGGSFRKSSKLLVFLLPFFLPAAMGTLSSIRSMALALIVGGVVTTIYGLLDMIDGDPHRLGGVIGFYMTTSGILVPITLLAFTIAVSRGLDRRFLLIVRFALPLLVAGLIATFTRGAWLGATAGLFAVTAVQLRRWIALPVAIVILALVIPGPVRDTAFSAVDRFHSRNRERLFMYEAGMEIFKDNPVTGVGHAGMGEIYLEYADPAAREKAGHLHSTPIHLLASMGIVGATAWLWLFGAVLVWLVRSLRRTERGPPIAIAILAAALGAWVAFVIQGLFEWNMGDIEVTTLFWTIIGLAGAASAVAARTASDPDS